MFHIKHKIVLLLTEEQNEQTLYTTDVPSSVQGHNQRSVPPQKRSISTPPSGCCYRWIQREVKTFQPSLLSLQGVPDFISRISGNENGAAKPHCWLSVSNAGISNEGWSMRIHSSVIRWGGKEMPVVIILGQCQWQMLLLPWWEKFTGGHYIKA